MDMADTAEKAHPASTTSGGRLQSLPYRITPAADNISREFARLEDERLWGKVWMIACREQELARPGDFVTYDIARDSILIVKQADGSLKAFYNVCQHRGRRLKAYGLEPRGGMSGNTGNQIRCAYHAWRWNIDGEIAYVCDKEDYAGVQQCSDDKLALKPVRLDTWGGWVWINMDPDAVSLAEYLGPVPEHLDPYEVEKCKIAWHHTIIFPCNWKTVAEAFNEGYHVEGTHTQITKMGWQPSISRAFGDHGWFGYEAAPASDEGDEEMVKVGSAPPPSTDQAIDFRKVLYDAQVEALETLKCLTSDYAVEAARRLSEVLPIDASYPEVAAKNYELHQQIYAELGIEWPKNLNPATMQKAGTDWHIFPNQICLPAIDGAEWYRLRPNGDDPASCIFDVWWLQRYPEGKEPPIKHQFWPTPESFKGENPFLEQDFGNLVAVQQGMHSRGFEGQRTNPVQEVAISNFHRALHRYLGLDENGNPQD